MAKNCRSRSIDIISNILILIRGQDHVDTAISCSAVCLIMRACSNGIRFSSFSPWALYDFYLYILHKLGGEPVS